ncbi:MAG: hypothetical protein HKN44_06955 [Ilumatobacter sp.]|nr:hypothetical protein [Ilumatobacter sp.]
MLGVVLAAAAPGAASASTVGATTAVVHVQAPPPTDEPPVDAGPPVTANEFLPENRDVTECIGALERPGCGSEQRGGWRQFAVLGVLFAGLLVVFGRIAIAVRRRG